MKSTKRERLKIDRFDFNNRLIDIFKKFKFNIQ